jgi:peptidoglycan/LPS O-acetylase OafA/YrhL
VQEIRSLTSLRGIFALMILIYHTLEIGFGIYQPILSYGVEGFFGLSGFLLYKIYSKNFNKKKFIVRRIFRIIPLYAFCVAVFYLSAITKFTPLWSIYTEEMFYFIALPLIIKYKPSTKLILTLGVLSELARVIFFVIPEGVYQANLNPIWYYYALLPFQFLPFAIGIAIARQNIQTKPWMIKADKILGNRVLMFLGLISYGVYMVHVPMLGWFGPWVGIVATFALATTTYFTFEKGCIQFARDKTSETEYK